MELRTLRSTVGAALVLLLVSSAASWTGQKPSKKAVQTQVPTVELVWPLPPAPPRIRWIGQIADFNDVRGRTQKKRSWIDRVAGDKSVDEPVVRLQRPYGIAVDSQGRIYVADGYLRAVFVFDVNSRQVATRGGSGRVVFGLPTGVALDERDRLFVSDSLNDTITCLSPDGKVLAQFGHNELGRPGGIAVDRKRQRLYVADAKAHRVAVFNTETFAFDRYVGSPSTPGVGEPGRFAAPTNVAVDPQGNLYVTDTWNHRVQIFDRRGRFLRAFGVHGTRPGSFVRPKGIALDSQGHIYVADAEFNNVQIFTPEGQPLLSIGRLGSDRGEFTLITGIFVDAQDRIYTTEQEGGRVQIFQFLSQAPAANPKEVSQRRK